MIDIFVFGSNLAGRHGKGAALHAKRFYGAQYGVGEGLTGCAYAIPTKGHFLEILPLESITASINRFSEFAWNNPSMRFLLTPVGCGLAGYTVDQIKPLFDAANLPANVDFLDSWSQANGAHT